MCFIRICTLEHVCLLHSLPAIALMSIAVCRYRNTSNYMATLKADVCRSSFFFMNKTCGNYLTREHIEQWSWCHHIANQLTERSPSLQQNSSTGCRSRPLAAVPAVRHASSSSWSDRWYRNTDSHAVDKQPRTALVQTCRTPEVWWRVGWEGLASELGSCNTLDGEALTTL